MKKATTDVRLKDETKDLIICDALSVKEAVKLMNKQGFVFVRTAGQINVFVPDDVDVISRFSINKKEEFILLKKVKQLFVVFR